MNLQCPRCGALRPKVMLRRTTTELFELDTAGRPTKAFGKRINDRLWCSECRLPFPHPRSSADRKPEKPQ